MRHRFVIRAGLGLALALAAAGAAAPAASAAPEPGTVYVSTNAPFGNAVTVFRRAADGTLSAKASYFTGGTGTGSALASAGALASARHGRLLFVVNAGSDSISAFRVLGQGNRLRLVDTVASGGDMPVSLTATNHWLYVLNAGGAGDISGFRIGAGGALSALPGSTRPLSGPAAGPAQIAFDPAGRVLVVTEKTANAIDTYTVDASGNPTGPTTHPSAGAEPFGFAFGGRGRVIVSEAQNGAAGASTVSSYVVTSSGGLLGRSATVPTGQTAACWVAVTGDGRYAYTANTGSGTLTAFAVGHGASLTRLAPSGASATTGAAPADLALSRGDRYLYVLNGGDGTVSGFAVHGDGTLTAAGTSGGLPLSAAGLLAR